MCKVTEDCYDLISHWNLRDSFKSSLEMVCSTEGQCKSTNRQLWRRGTITGRDFCDQKLEMKNVFDTTGPSREKSFKRCKTSPFLFLRSSCKITFLDVSMVQLQRNVMPTGDFSDLSRLRLGILWTELQPLVGSHLALDHQAVNSVQRTRADAESIMIVLYYSSI